MKFEIEKLKNEQSSTDKTNKGLRKLLEVERKSCKDAEKNVMDADFTEVDYTNEIGGDTLVVVNGDAENEDDDE
ncbi:hypothetical protein MTR_8g026850 [Medicago truncatula]|uniref:Uncharacterized protein n=1 Tax=Medicago truncatula TaxID=3880 RepID=G7LAS3_MEDTR|nr:hypothetical protein MTR_8g026850 [Medicago truncatula]